MQILYLPVIIAVAVAFVALAFHLRTRPLAAATIVITTYVIESLLVNVPALPLGLMLYPDDIVFGLLLVSVLLRYGTRMAKPNTIQWISIGLFFLFSIGLVRGFSAFGIKQAGNESRETFDFLVGVLYFSSFRLSPQIMRRLISIWLSASMVLVGIAVFRWIATLAGLSIAVQWEGLLVEGELRVLNASNAYFLAMAFFASVFLNMNNIGSSWQRKAFYLFGPVLLLLQHRTVWAVMIIGLLWMGMKDARFRRMAIGAVVGMAIVGVVLVAILFGHRSEIAAASIQASAGNSDSFLWRVEGWYQLLFNNPARNLFNDTIGQPFGTGFERMVLGERVDVAPHNYYVSTFLRLGMIGLFLLIGLFTLGMRRLKLVPVQLRRYVYPDARFWSLVLLLQLVYFFTYGANYDQSILAGFAIAGMRLRLKQPLSPTFGTPEFPCAEA
jgi:hypothetical protein